ANAAAGFLRNSLASSLSLQPVIMASPFDLILACIRLLYIPGPHGFDSLIVGYYQGKDLMYVARVRNGFVPASRRQVFERIHHLVCPTMPFANLPDTHKSRWGDELTAEKMKECVWLRPEAVAQVEFLEWTGADRLRHSKFVGLRDDKN